MPSADDLLEGEYMADAIERVTEGHANRRVRSAWRERKLLITPTVRLYGKAGNPIAYPRLGLIEARLIYEAGRAGIDQSVIAAAFKARIEAEGHRQRIAEAGGAVGGYLNEADIDEQTVHAAVRSGRLREFDRREPGEDDAFWFITYDAEPSRRVTAVRCVAGELLHLPAALAGILARDSAHTTIVVTNVTRAVRAVDAVLEGGK